MRRGEADLGNNHFYDKHLIRIPQEVAAKYTSLRLKLCAF